MQRLGTGNPGDGIHQLLLDLAALDVHGNIRVIHNGLAEKNLFQFWSQIHGHKAELLPGALIVHLGNVNKAILELVDNVVVFLPAIFQWSGGRWSGTGCHDTPEWCGHGS